jgi:serine/threonine protein kinase
MNQDSCTILSQLLESHPKKQSFKEDHSYLIKLHNSLTDKTEPTKVKLSHKMIKRRCHKHAGEHRYEAVHIHKPIDIGASCEIHQSICTITPAQNGTPLSYQAKIQALKLFDPSVETYTAEHEYRITPRHLKMKPPVHIGNHIGIFMRWAGQSLHKMLQEARNGTRELPIEQRIELCIAIAKALKTQVHDNDLVHRDLHPDNIGVTYHEKKSRWKVLTLDFGESKKSSHADTHLNSFGTEGYMAPEIKRKENTTKKSDIYSLGCIYSEILGCTRDLPEKTLKKERLEGSISLDGLLDTLADGKKISKEKCISLLQDMTANIQKDRPDIKTIVSRLKDIATSTLTEEFARLSLKSLL